MELETENSVWKSFLKTKGLTKEEYIFLELDYSDEEIKFIDEMAEKYPGGSVNKKDPSDEFIQFITKEIEKDEYIPNFPILLMKDKDVEFLKYNDGENTHYSVDINNKSVGMSICFTDNIDEAKEFYEKEKYYNKVQKADDEIVNRICYVNSIFGQDLDKVIICDEELFGRRTNLIDYFNNELAHANEYFPDEEQTEEKKMFINKTKEAIDELKNSKDQLEPVYLFISPMDNSFTIANKEDQLENIKNLYIDYEIANIEKIFLELNKNSDILNEKNVSKVLSNCLFTLEGIDERNKAVKDETLKEKYPEWATKENISLINKWGELVKTDLSIEDIEIESESEEL